MSTYYNEIDPFAAQWLRNLIAGGVIAAGDVDERSITEVSADDVKNYTQCHFFAGIGVWSHALRLAGWPDDRPVWTGSCPCQPFSAAGKQRGTDDERHLWPVWFELIRQAKPAAIFGEQVDAAIKHGWLDTVCNDLEAANYTTGAICLPAASAGAPHIRQRLWFVANNKMSERQWAATGAKTCGAGLTDCSSMGYTDHQRCAGQPVLHEQRSKNPEAARAGAAGQLADSDKHGSQGRLSGRTDQEWEAEHRSTGCGGTVGGLGYSDNDTTHSAPQVTHHCQSQGYRPANIAGRHGLSLGGYWSDCDWLYCKDEKWRPVESGTFPLADGAAARVGRLRAYGNAIVPQVAAEVIKVFMEYAP